MKIKGKVSPPFYTLVSMLIFLLCIAIVFFIISRYSPPDETLPGKPIQFESQYISSTAWITEVRQMPQFKDAVVKKLPIKPGATGPFQPITIPGAGYFSLNYLDRNAFCQSSISLDGSRLLLELSSGAGVSKVVVVNIASGETHQVLITPADEDRTMEPLWDPENSNYLYLTNLEDKDNDRAVWKVKYDGTHSLRVTAKDEYAYLYNIIDNSLLLSIEKQLALGTKGKAVYYLQGIHDRKQHITIKPEEYKYYLNVSPDNNYSVFLEAYTVPGQCDYLSFYNMNTSHLNPVLDIGQLLSSSSEQVVNREVERINWLMDSSAVILSIRRSKHGNSYREELWLVTTNGKVNHIADGVSVIATSPDSQYWLFLAHKDFYLCHAKRK